MIYDTSYPEEKKRAEVRFESLLSKGKKFELKEIKAKRSLSQNSYLHVLFSLYGIENGYNLIESKSLVKRSCPWMIYETKGVKFVRETSKLDKDEMTKFIEWFRNWSGQQGCYLPNAEEYTNSRSYYDGEIDRCETFL
jgi:hypothetical protein